MSLAGNRVAGAGSQRAVGERGELIIQQMVIDMNEAQVGTLEQVPRNSPSAPGDRWSKRCKSATMKV